MAMDDPIHPQDEARLQEVIREKARQMEKGSEDEEDAKARAKQKQKPDSKKMEGPKRLVKMTKRLWGV